MTGNDLADALKHKIAELEQGERELNGLPTALRLTREQKTKLSALLPGVLTGDISSIRNAEHALGRTPTEGQETPLVSPTLIPRDLSPDETRRIEEILDRPGFSGTKS